MTGPGWAACHGAGDSDIPAKNFTANVTLAADELAVARLAALDEAAAAWAEAYQACNPAEREVVRARAARLGTDPDTWAALERLALEQEARPWPRR